MREGNAGATQEDPRVGSSTPNTVAEESSARTADFSTFSITNNHHNPTSPTSILSASNNVNSPILQRRPVQDAININPRRKPPSCVHRSRDLPRRVLLQDDTSTSRKRQAGIQAPVTPAKRRRKREYSVASVTGLSTVVEETTTVVTTTTIVDERGATGDGGLEAGLVQEGGLEAGLVQVPPEEEFLQFDGTMSVAQLDAGGDSGSSPRTPPRTSVATLPVTPMAPLKRPVERIFHSAASSQIARRLNFD